MQTKQFSKTKNLAILGILSAIVILQNFIPFLGYIPFPGINPTIIHVTVIIAAVSLGYKNGVILGLVWGIACVVRAYTNPTTIIDTTIFTNPIVSVLPRMMVGLLSGLSYSLLSKTRIKPVISMAIAGVIGSFTNTIIVLGLIYLMFGAQFAAFVGTNVDGLMPVILGIVATSGIGEAIVAAIFVPAICHPLSKVIR